MSSFRYPCLVHISPYVAIEYGLYHHPVRQDFSFARMPRSYTLDKVLVGTLSLQYKLNYRIGITGVRRVVSEGSSRTNNSRLPC